MMDIFEMLESNIERCVANAMVSEILVVLSKNNGINFVPSCRGLSTNKFKAGVK